MQLMTMTTEPQEVSYDEQIPSCCSAFYEQDWVRTLAEDSFHPGGAELTRRTVAAMALPANGKLLDLGCGTGTTALLIGREFDYAVTGIDTSAANIKRASERATSTSISFKLADAHSLSFENSRFDGIIAECVFSLLSDKPVALTELLRILKPGGRIGITDMAIQGALPGDLADAAAPWTCLADALDENGYRAMFTDAGFTVAEVVDESAGLDTLLRNIKRKLVLAGAGGILAGKMPLDLSTIRYWLDRFATEVDNGSIRYLRFQLTA